MKIEKQEVADYAGELGSFLNGEVDLETIWQNFDKDGNGYIDSSEFKDLLYMCLAVFVFSKTDDKDVASIPSPEDLDVSLTNLTNTLMPAVDKSGDGVIDFEEFKSIGDYLSQQFARKDEDEANNNDNHLGLDLNDIANQVIFQNVTEEEMVMKVSGHTTYVGSQIIFYESTEFLNWGAFYELNGTVLKSPMLWTKMLFLGFVATIGGIVCEFGLGPDARNADGDFLLKLDGFEPLLVGLVNLLAFFAGLYLQQILDRWWVIRSEGVAGVVTAVTDLSLALSSFLHNDGPQERRVKNIITRYGLLTHALIYFEAQVFFEPQFRSPESQVSYWEELKTKGLITQPEVDVLKTVRNRRPEAVWSWILSFLQYAIENGELPEEAGESFEHFAEICRGGRKASSLVTLHIECQLPLPYVHLICFVINLYQVIFSFVSGIIVVGAYSQGHTATNGTLIIDGTQRMVVQVIIFFLYNVIYQGILETAEKMANPLGDDDIDFPQVFISTQLMQECKALFATAVQLPWDKNKKSLNDGDMQPSDFEQANVTIDEEMYVE